MVTTDITAKTEGIIINKDRKRHNFRVMFSLGQKVLLGTEICLCCALFVKSESAGFCPVKKYKDHLETDVTYVKNKSVPIL